MSDNTPSHSRFFWRTSALFFMLDPSGRFLEVNSAWEKKLELSTGKLLSKAFVSFIHPEDKETTQAALKRLITGTVSVSFTARFHHHNGLFTPVLWEITAAASQEIGMYGVGVPVAEKEKANHQEEILNALNDGVVLQLANGMIGACNPGAERILGLSCEHMFVWTLLDPDWPAYHEDGSPFPVETHPAICTLRTGQAYADAVIGIERPDGVKQWLRMNTTPIWRDDVTTPYAVLISFADITAFKKTEETLRQRHGAGQAQVGLWEWLPDSGAMIFSRQWKPMLGYAESDLPNQINTWLDRVHPLDYARVKADLEDCQRGKRPLLENEHRLQHKNGGYRQMSCRAYAAREDNGALRIIGFHADITEQPLAESHHQSDKYQQLLDIESAAIFIVDAETGKILEVNKAATQIYGYSRKEFMEKSRWDLSAQVEKFGKTTRRQQYSRLRHHRRKDGGVFPVEITVALVESQGRAMEMLLIRDITEKQDIETALWESQSKYRQLFEASSSAIIVFDPNTQHIFDVNSVALHLYGYTKDEYVHLSVEDLSGETSRARATLTPSGKRTNLIPLRWHKKKDGSLFPVEISIGSTYLFQGRSLVCATIKDITERRDQEEALRKEKEFIHTLVQASPAYFYAINPNGKIRMMNRAMLEALGYAHDEVVEQEYLKFIPEDEKIMASAEFDSLIKSLRPSMMESHMLAKNGRAVLIEWHSRALVQADGSLDYLLSVGIDVTERTEAQSNLRLFRSIIHASEEAIAISGRDGKLIYINPAHEKLFGQALPQTQGKARAYYPPESQEIIQREVAPVLARGGSWSGELDAMDVEGNRFPIWERADAVRDSTGQILYHFELMHNISERQRMWETLRGQWEEYQALFNNIPVMIWYRDRDNRLLRANQQASRVLNLEREPAKFYADNMVVVRSGQAAAETIAHYPDLQGNMRWIKAGRLPYRSKDGEILGVTLYAVDISEYKYLEQISNENQNKIKMLLNDLPFLIVACDTNGRIIAWNQEAERITGYKSEETVGRQDIWQRLLPSAAVAQELIHTEQDFNYREIPVHCKDGAHRPILWSRMADKFPISSWPQWLLGEDLAKRTATSLSALRMEEMLLQLFLASGLGIAITDDRGRYLRVNPAYASLFGFSPEELLGQPFTVILPEKYHEDAIREYFGKLLNSNTPMTIHSIARAKPRTNEFAVEGTAERIVLEDGRRVLMSILSKKA